MTSGPVVEQQPWWRRARAFVYRYEPLRLCWRFLVLLVGGVVLLAGVVMLVTPGPGWLALIAGLAILATEFTWAERLLRWAKDRAKAAANKALDPRARRYNLVATGLALILAVGVAWWWVLVSGVPAWITDTWQWVRDAI